MQHVTVPAISDSIMGILEQIQTQLAELHQAVCELRQQPAAVAEPEILDMEAACTLLARSKATVEKLCRDRVIPCYQASPGGVRLFKRSELLAYIDSMRQPTVQELSADRIRAIAKRRA